MSWNHFPTNLRLSQRHSLCKDKGCIDCRKTRTSFPGDTSRLNRGQDHGGSCGLLCMYCFRNWSRIQNLSRIQNPMTVSRMIIRVDFATVSNKMAGLLQRTYRCQCATLGQIECWATCLLRCPFIDTSITVRATTTSTAASNFTAPTHARTWKGDESATQERAHANCASLSFDLTCGKEEQKKYE